ncbi:PRC-barrel domain-containing protein [Rhodoferax antarcticus]|uniref:Putative photosystem reaction center subunit H n=1 Tax=Rhodoferax antarcticus ANT.BR TaxID=1111071 RepID=A0A1Q8YA11_9BURK|nr:PRC-barrel domain-containing protein [Rhodoferax antarcticus]APW47017.1 photosystem reaction center subunit H [Rhodoferax antarcticus]OLP04881.1 putative photosystem reaction center subunit H [Rhodoferax antarcticus ANT.BR]
MNYVERDSFGMYAVADSGGPGPRLMGADTLLGNAVFNRQEEDLGSVKEIMLDVRAGRISYAVLSYGGLLGIGDKLFAVPWAALTLDTDNKRFTLDVTKDRLERAPGFDKDNWPNMSNQEWAKDLDDYYGTQPTPSP